MGRVILDMRIHGNGHSENLVLLRWGVNLQPWPTSPPPTPSSPPACFDFRYNLTFDRQQVPAFFSSPSTTSSPWCRGLAVRGIGGFQIALNKVLTLRCSKAECPPTTSLKSGTLEPSNHCIPPGAEDDAARAAGLPQHAPRDQ